MYAILKRTVCWYFFRPKLINALCFQCLFLKKKSINVSDCKCLKNKSLDWKANEKHYYFPEKTRKKSCLVGCPIIFCLTMPSPLISRYQIKGTLSVFLHVMTFDDKEQCSKSKVQSNNTEQKRLNKTFKEIKSRIRYHAGFKINGKP